MAVDYTGAVDEGIQASRLVYNSLYSLLVNTLHLPGWLAQIVAAVATVPIAIGRVLYIIVLFGFVSLGTTLVTAVLQVIKQIRQDGASDFAEVTGEVLGEFMAIDTQSVDFKTGKSPAASLERAKQLGDIIINMLQSQFGTTGPQTPDAGEKAAKALAGYGVNFATSNVFLSWLVELSTHDKFQDFDKLGEDIASTLGLGRLTRRALQPLIRNAISHPYDRKMRALYRPDIPAAAELVKGFLSGKITEADCNTYLAQHGFSDAFIDLIKAQHTPDLNEGDIDLLEAIGALGVTSGAGQLKAQGIPDSIATWRLQAHAWKRVNHVRESILGEVFSQIHNGFRPASDMDVICSTLGIPIDETNLWRQRVGQIVEQPRKRLSHADMLFLYEAAQLTLEEVGQWAAAEGYSLTDQQNIQVLFTLKAAASHSGKSGGAAAKAVHTHNEHVAYVIDEIAGLWGRKPTTAEVNFWVTLLDQGDRTKHDFVTELKELPTTGPAIPPSP